MPMMWLLGGSSADTRKPMASYRFMRETFNRTPDDLDEDRLVAAVVELAMAAAREHGLA